MPTSTILLLLLAGIALVAGSLLLRVFSAGKYEIKTIDLVFLVIPLLLVALATGKLKGIDMFGVKADLSELLTDAAKGKIKEQVAPSEQLTVQDAVQVVEMAGKGGIQQLRVLIERRIEALELRLGHGGYYGPALKTYFEALSGSSYLRVVVVNQPDGKLFGMFNAANLISYLRVAGDGGYQQFQQLLNSSSASNWAELSKLPGFVAVQSAVTSTTSRRDALERMETLRTDSLPVVNQDGYFMGTVERSKLTASLILAVTRKLDGEAP
ncbi:CBS domain-containing protein [Pseudomonas sp. BMS12]|uniref:CBS domain-containing protein n=1 Tax=Pseudomonas sp. BMS12 TaxID=1796033 RepID=UPI000839FD1C|nr:CBS domain-containing protein [Pseudomonas sp. BMS12]